MNKNTKKITDSFWKDIVIDARDSVLKDMNELLKGKSNDQIDKKRYQQILSLNLGNQTMNLIKALICDQIDSFAEIIFIKIDESFGKYKVLAKNANEVAYVTDPDEDSAYNYLDAIDNYSKYKSSADIAVEDIFDKEWKLEK